MNAQEYLEKAAIPAGEYLASKGWEFNAETGVPLGLDVKIHCGLPMRRSKKTQAVILPARMSDANLTEIFIAAHIDDSYVVVGLVIRCLLQVATGAISKPNRTYVAAAVNLGFGGVKDMLHPQEGSDLSRAVAEIVSELGEYPHTATGAVREPAPGVLFKLACENGNCKSFSRSNGKKSDSGYNHRASAKWAFAGATCPFCHTKLVVYDPDKNRVD